MASTRTNAPRSPGGLSAHEVIVSTGFLALLFVGAWRLSPWLAAAAAAGSAAVAWRAWRGHVERQRNGYHVEYLTASVLRGADDELAVIYHESDRQLAIEGEHRRRQPDLLRVPSAAAWRNRTPSWAHERRDEILARILSDRAVQHCEIVEV